MNPAPEKSPLGPFPISRYLISGAIAGAISRTAVAPLERIKIIFQVQSLHPNHTPYESILGSIKRIWVKEGMAGLFRGNGIHVVRIVPYTACQFGASEAMRQILQDSSPSNWSVSSRLLAGGVAGVVAVTLTYPLDIIRTRISVASAIPCSHSNLFSTSTPKPITSKTTHSLPITTTLFATTSPPKATHSSPNSRPQKPELSPPFRQTIPHKPLPISEAGSSTLVSPKFAPSSTFPVLQVSTTTRNPRVSYKTIKKRDLTSIPNAPARLPLSLPSLKSWLILRHIVQTEGGGKAIYRGWTPSILSILPFMVVNFEVNQVLQTISLRFFDVSPHSVLLKLACGGVATALAQTITYPLDVVRRRMQVSACFGQQTAYASLRTSWMTIYRGEGARGFFKGIIPCYLKILPAMGISFIVYQQTDKLLKNYI